jgi:hypothetical protein
LPQTASLLQELANILADERLKNLLAADSVRRLQEDHRKQLLSTADRLLTDGLGTAVCEQLLMCRPY